MIDETTDLDAELNEDVERTLKDADGIPYCRVHHCRMIQASGGKKGNPKAYYKCKHADCKETARIIKTPDPRVVPDQLQECPRCVRDGKPVICERDASSSNAARVVLKCPCCGWKSTAYVVPQMAAAQLVARQRPMQSFESIGER